MLLVATVLTALVKPERAIQLVPLMVLWPLALFASGHEAPSLFGSWRKTLFILFFTYVPLVDTWPARIVKDAVLHIDTRWWAGFLLPEFLALCVLLACSPKKLRRRNLVFLAIMCLFALGGIVSLVHTPDLQRSIEQLITGVFVVILAYLVFLNVALEKHEWMAALSGFFVTALCPVVLGLIGYFATFGAPLAVDEFMRNKEGMYIVGELQKFTYGNVGHLAEYLLLTTIPAVGLLVYRWRASASTYVVRVIYIAYIVLSVVLSIYIQVRGLVLCTLIGMLLLMAFEGTRRRLMHIAPAVTVFVVVAATSLLLYGSFYRSLVPTLRPLQVPVEAATPHVVSTSVAGGKPGAKETGSPVTGAKPASKPVLLTEQAEPRRVQTTSKSVVSPLTTGSAGSGLETSASNGESIVDRISVDDVSADLRWTAINQGFHIIRNAWPLGVGLGVYEFYAPELTAAHSFAVQAVAEAGLLGALFVIAIVLYVIVIFVRQWLRRDAGFPLALTSAAFIAYICIFGGIFAIIGITVWGIIFALWVALVERGVFAGENK